MPRTTLIAAAGLIALTAAGTASAETYKVKFSYAPDATAQEIYASFAASAERACAREMRRDGRTALAIEHKLRNACAAELVDSAVSSLGHAQVTALHRNMTTDQRGTELAQAN